MTRGSRMSHGERSLCFVMSLLCGLQGSFSDTEFASYLVGIAVFFFFLGIAGPSCAVSAPTRLPRTKMVCPECGREGLQFFKDVRTEEGGWGLTYKTTIKTTTPSVKCSHPYCNYQSSVARYRRTIEANTFQAARDAAGSDEVVELIDYAEKSVEWDRQRAELNDTKNGSRHPHPEDARLVDECGRSCPACQNDDSIRYVRWINGDEKYNNAMGGKVSKFFADCLECRYTVRVGTHKQNCREAIV